jgi:hypothetical protein
VVMAVIDHQCVMKLCAICSTCSFPFFNVFSFLFFVKASFWIKCFTFSKTYVLFM